MSFKDSLFRAATLLMITSFTIQYIEIPLPQRRHRNDTAIMVMCWGWEGEISYKKRRFLAAVTI